MFTRPESDRVVYWKRHYHGLETSAFVFFVGRVTTMNRIDMSFEVRLSVNRLSISSVQNRVCKFLKSGPKFYCSLEVDSVLHSSLL